MFGKISFINTITLEVLQIITVTYINKYLFVII